ncbi:MAG: hypothetical protein A4E69_00033 [Syntrophus sp. PtaB.Bin138]|jgi:hypothetical protein|nr:MAG: hypothetical protein A4E69_00033 [Syntrophus sp. PtaB.Bin138]
MGIFRRTVSGRRRPPAFPAVPRGQTPFLKIPRGRAGLICLGIALVMTAVFPVLGVAEWRSGGKIETFSAFYTQRKTGKDDQYSEVRFRPNITVSGNDLLFYGEADLRVDTLNYDRGYVDDIVDRDETRKIFGIREAYGEYGRKWLRLRAGKQVFDWSVTDTISPSDNIAPRDYLDVVEWERLGVPSVSARLGYDSYVEFVYVPWFTPSKLPAEGGRWERDLPPGMSYGEQDLPGRSRGQFAFRAGMVAAGFDMGVSLYQGYSYSPFYRTGPPSAAPLQFVPCYKEETVYAASLAKEVHGYNLRAEAGYFDQRGEDRFVQYVAGIDREWANILREGDAFYALLQYSGEAKTYSSHSLSSEMIDFRRVFNNSLTWRVGYTLDPGRQWTVKAKGSYNFSGGDSLIEPAVVWRKDRFEIEGGVDILSGPTNSFWGGYGNDDRLFLKMNIRY